MGTFCDIKTFNGYSSIHQYPFFSEVFSHAEAARGHLARRGRGREGEAKGTYVGSDVSCIPQQLV